MRLLVCGSRSWRWEAPIRRAILDLDPDEIVHGAAVGADSIAHAVGVSLDIRVIPCPVLPEEWRRYGKGAPNQRNARMLRDHGPDFVVAFLNPPSPGTADMVSRALEAGLKVRMYRVRRTTGGTTT